MAGNWGARTDRSEMYEQEHPNTILGNRAFHPYQDWHATTKQDHPPGFSRMETAPEVKSLADYSRRQESLNETGWTKTEKPPKLAKSFSGNPTDEGCCEFTEFEYIVATVRSRYTDEAIKEAVMLALKGSAFSLVLNLGVSTPLDEVMSSLRSSFAPVREPDATGKEFFNMTQEPDEEVSAFRTRLELAASEWARVEEIVTLTSEKRDRLLLRRFLGGLRAGIVLHLNHLRDKPGITFQEAFDEARRVEQRVKTHRIRTREEKESKKEEKKPVATTPQQVMQKRFGGGRPNGGGFNPGNQYQ
jgi:hypothetical protein